MPNVRHFTLAAAVAIGATPLAIATAQDSPAGVRPYRFTISGHLANYWFDRGGSADRASVGGYGVRAMFNRSDAARIAQGFFGRASAGAYATFTAEQDGVSTQSFGGEVDVALFAAPIARGFLDPFFSLGVGVLRSDPDSPTVETSTDFAVTPGAGTRIPFFSGMGFRGDLRVPMVFSDGDTRAHFLAEGGIYISF
jgi:hypothetical protein